MSKWCNWYRVIKACGRDQPRYIYDQSTRRVNGRTETRNRYIGIAGEHERRKSGGSAKAKLKGSAAVVGSAPANELSMTQHDELLNWLHMNCHTDAITYRGKPHYVKMTFSGAYYLEPVGWTGKKTDGFAPGTVFVGNNDWLLPGFYDDVLGAGRPVEQHPSERVGVGHMLLRHTADGPQSLEEALEYLQQIARDECGFSFNEVSDLLKVIDQKTPAEIIAALQVVDEQTDRRFLREEVNAIIAGIKGWRNMFERKPADSVASDVAPVVRQPIGLTYLQDPAHGWLMVPRDVLTSVGLSPEDFSEYSYVNGDMFALEKDSDMAVFMKRARDKGLLFERHSKQLDAQAGVRNWHRNEASLDSAERMALQINQMFGEVGGDTKPKKKPKGKSGAQQILETKLLGLAARVMHEDGFRGQELKAFVEDLDGITPEGLVRRLTEIRAKTQSDVLKEELTDIIEREQDKVDDRARVDAIFKKLAKEPKPKTRSREEIQAQHKARLQKFREEESSRLQQALEQFSGTNDYHRSINRNVVYTDGVKHFADEAGAHWLLDIASTELDTLAKQHGLVFVTATSDGRKAKLTCVRDSGEPPLWSRDIEMTDLPAGEWKLWMGEGGPQGTTTIFLPSEY